MKFFDILAYAILTALSAFITWGGITSGSMLAAVLGAAATTLWLVNLVMRLTLPKRK